MLVTRAADQSSDVVGLFEREGAQVTTLPLIRIGPPPDERRLQESVDGADTYQWIVFTSAAGVEGFARRRAQPLAQRVRLAVVGPATQSALKQRLDTDAHVIPAQFNVAALAEALIQSTGKRDRVLIVAAQDSSPVLAAKLRAAGLEVDKIDAYTTVESAPRDLGDAVARSDVITLASPSAVRALLNGLGSDATAALRGKLLACIGPVTLLEARERGLHVEIVPDQATLPALVAAVCRYYSATLS